MADYLSVQGWAVALLQAAVFVLAAPMLAAWTQRLRARLQNRKGPALLQPYRDLYKLFHKEPLAPRTASPVFLVAPYIVFVSTVLACLSVPLLLLPTPASATADMIVLVGFLALGRFFLALAAMDTGTAFGGIGASREMLVAALAEPAMLMAVFTLAMSAHTTNLSSVVEYQLGVGLSLRPSYLFALLALLLVAVAESGRIPIDNPSTHLELTMIHEAMVLEYSGRHLALMEWAAQLKLMLYGVLLANIFFPWGIATQATPVAMAQGLGAIALKLALLAVVLAVSETVLAKMRLFRVPQYLNLALLLGLLGMLSNVILESIR